jgi:hypothetical protein
MTVLLQSGCIMNCGEDRLTNLELTVSSSYQAILKYIRR